MGGWILLFLLLVFILAVIEETIYYFTNRNVFGPGKIEEKLKSGWQLLISKAKLRNNPSSHN